MTDKRKIIGFAGRKRSGKTCLAKVLQENEGAVIITIADYLKRLCCKLLEMSYDELIETKKKDYELEILNNIDVTYEHIKLKVSEGKFRDKEVTNFIKLLEKRLQRLLEILKEVQVEPDYPDRTKIEELTRKALRDYRRLITIYIEEEDSNG